MTTRAQVTPVGSGTHNIKNPIFWSFFPGAGALCKEFNELVLRVLSILATSTYKLALRLADSESFLNFSSRSFRWSTNPSYDLEKIS